MKLYLVGRRDLAPGLLAAQLVHAQRQFQADHPVRELAWYTGSNTLALLSVENEEELLDLAERVRQSGLAVSVWREPDLDNAATAIAIDPDGRRFVRNLPLALAAA